MLLSDMQHYMGCIAPATGEPMLIDGFDDTLYDLLPAATRHHILASTKEAAMRTLLHCLAQLAKH